jgi:hypothetical protein
MSPSPRSDEAPSEGATSPRQQRSRNAAAQAALRLRRKQHTDELAHRVATLEADFDAERQLTRALQRQLAAAEAQLAVWRAAVGAGEGLEQAAVRERERRECLADGLLDIRRQVDALLAGAGTRKAPADAGQPSDAAASPQVAWPPLSVDYSAMAAPAGANKRRRRGDPTNAAPLLSAQASRPAQTVPQTYGASSSHSEASSSRSALDADDMAYLDALPEVQAQAMLSDADLWMSAAAMTGVSAPDASLASVPASFASISSLPAPASSDFGSEFAPHRFAELLDKRKSMPSQALSSASVDRSRVVRPPAEELGILDDTSPSSPRMRLNTSTPTGMTAMSRAQLTLRAFHASMRLCRRVVCGNESVLLPVAKGV